ncbi:enoyl-CoA hydratase/isomerase family protein [Aquicoccus sp. SCR17]|nr:enoyl-CoA hydratase/isomerase family protein [Carideicomes alvinocaridis]
MGDGTEILFECKDGIATVTLNRPERRNALSVAMANRLFEAWEEVDARDDIRVAILTSAPCGTFCAGMDLKEASELRREKGVDILTLIQDPFHERMRAVRKPVIAAMTGHFAAGGFMLALNSDIRVGLAGTSGGITEAKVGRGCPWAMPVLWQLPQPIVMELVLSAEVMSVERLHNLGFVNHVESDPDAVLRRAQAIAERIRDNAPLSVRAAKESVLRTIDRGCAAGIEDAKRIHEAVYASEDAQEGPRAFAEMRAPVWQGR